MREIRNVITERYVFDLQQFYDDRGLAYLLSNSTELMEDNRKIRIHVYNPNTCYIKYFDLQILASVVFDNNMASSYDILISVESFGENATPYIINNDNFASPQLSAWEDSAKEFNNCGNVIVAWNNSIVEQEYNLYDVVRFMATVVRKNAIVNIFEPASTTDVWEGPFDMETYTDEESVTDVDEWYATYDDEYWEEYETYEHDAASAARNLEDEFDREYTMRSPVDWDNLPV